MKHFGLLAVLLIALMILAGCGASGSAQCHPGCRDVGCAVVTGCGTAATQEEACGIAASQAEGIIRGEMKKCPRAGSGSVVEITVHGNDNITCEYMYIADWCP